MHACAVRAIGLPPRHAVSVTVAAGRAVAGAALVVDLVEAATGRQAKTRRH
jgi:hypothetical protein